MSFPREPKVSMDCRKLITKILAPLKVRVKIPQILADVWLNPNQSGKDEEQETTQVSRSLEINKRQLQNNLSNRTLRNSSSLNKKSTVFRVLRT